MIVSLLIANLTEIARHIIHTPTLRVSASSREPNLLILTRSRGGAEKNCPSVSPVAIHLPQQAVGGLAVGGFFGVTARFNQILPELVTGRWQPERLTEGNVV